MRSGIFCLLLFLGITSNVFALSGPPKPLRELVYDSDFIIVGFVTKTFYYNGDARIAKIAVLENLQGDINKDTIEIKYYPDMDCPEPFRYFDSTFVISFMSKSKKSDNFYIRGGKQGVKTLKQDEIEIYKQRILEIQQILQISDSAEQRDETVEWLVKCAEVEATRWEGTFELDPENELLSYNSGRKKVIFNKTLSTEQKERLKKALLSSSTMVDFILVDLVYKDNETEIDSFLLVKLKNLKENDFWLAKNFITRLKYKHPSKEMDKVLEEFYNPPFESNRIKKILEQFVALIEK